MSRFSHIVPHRSHSYSSFSRFPPFLLPSLQSRLFILVSHFTHVSTFLSALFPFPSPHASLSLLFLVLLSSLLSFPHSTHSPRSTHQGQGGSSRCWNAVVVRGTPTRPPWNPVRREQRTSGLNHTEGRLMKT